MLVEISTKATFITRLAVTVTLILFLVNMDAYAQRPSLDDLQNQINALSAQINGIGDQEIILDCTAVNTSSFKVLSVQCPPGKLVSGGGGRITFSPGSGSIGQALSSSYPSSSDTWTVAAISPTPASVGWQLVGYAVC